MSRTPRRQDNVRLMPKAEGNALAIQCFRAATRKPTIVCSPNAFAASSRCRPSTSTNIEPFLSIHAAPVGSGSPQERRRHNPVAAATLDNMDGAVGRISTRHDCQLQAALSDALVPLRFRLHSCGRAPDYATDNPCVASASADYVARGTTTAAAGRHAGTARGNQRAIISNLDSRT